MGRREAIGRRELLRRIAGWSGAALSIAGLGGLPGCGPISDDGHASGYLDYPDYADYFDYPDYANYGDYVDGGYSDYAERKLRQ